MSGFGRDARLLLQESDFSNNESGRTQALNGVEFGAGGEQRYSKRRLTWMDYLASPGPRQH
ncbi:hypothetical protein QEH68_04860 [Paenarthrobacter sp. OM7]|uniref:hypothetical protein n=1 Tax=Paenarthrobacter sp. OM7 TaxID=3041264 RepID=UPI0024697B17|nr:hypothetical protein [Paenarthrobacter sp. OM7]WGM21511.1 hypothetical protein QEH68_04860 [Paenarthrobacter sp. OM7]